MQILRIRKELCIYSWLDAVPDSAESKLNAPQESAEPNIALSGTALSGMDPGQAEHCPKLGYTMLTALLVCAKIFYIISRIKIFLGQEMLNKKHLSIIGLSNENNLTRCMVYIISKKPQNKICVRIK